LSIRQSRDLAGTLLRTDGVNIATFPLGRSGPGEDAIPLIEVDEFLGDALLARIREIPDVMQATALSF